MKRVFSVTSRLEDERIVWFVNRAEGGCGFALDELFSEEEIGPFEHYLRERACNYRIREYTLPVCAKDLPSWNLIGRLIHPDEAWDYTPPFRVLGCAEA